MSRNRSILCVLSKSQQQEYQLELDELREAGIELLMESSPEDALDRVGQENPAMVMVGMEVGTMEGLEFLALLMNRYADFDRQVVVIPDRDDPFPPVFNLRDPATGRSTSDEVELKQLCPRVLQALEQVQEPAVVPAAAVAAEPTVEPMAEPAAGPAAPLAAQELPPMDAPAPSRGPSRLPLVLVGVLVLAALGGGGYLLMSGRAPGEQPRQPMATQDTEPAAAADEKPAADEKSATDEKPAEPAPAADEKPAEPAPAVDEKTAADEEPAKPEPATPGLALDTEHPVPLTFVKGSSSPNVSDAVGLDQLVKTLKAQLKAEAGLRVVLSGHTSSEGDERYNKELGLNRARATRKLLRRKGIKGRRIKLQSQGGSQPLDSNDTPEGRARNRRVTLLLTSS